MTHRPIAGRSVALRVATQLLPLIVLAGCSIASSSVTGGVTIADPWVRPPMGPGQPAAGYLTITAANGSEDALIGASSPVAGSVEIHETTTDASGMMGMHPVDRVPVPAGSTVAFEPGGYHLMLMGVTGELRAGSTIELVLDFETAGEITVQAAIREE